MKTLQKLFSNNSEYDHKNILNKSPIKIKNDFLDKIEKGVSIEELEKLQKENNISIFKYKTQITVHGIFDNIDDLYVFGYKNIIQNKNKSLGIKWNAIDEIKRMDIAKKIYYLGFEYKRNSSKNSFYKMELFDDNNIDKLKEKYTSLYKKIDTSLFKGYKDLKLVKTPYGLNYIILEFSIGSIYEKNIDKFLSCIGYSQESHQAYKDKENLEIEKRKQKRLKEEKERKEKRDRELKENKDFKFIKEHFKKVEKIQDDGEYIKFGFNYKSDTIFTKIKIKTIKGKRFKRIEKKQFDTLKEALDFNDFCFRWSKTLNGCNITAYKM